MVSTIHALDTRYGMKFSRETEHGDIHLGLCRVRVGRVGCKDGMGVGGEGGKVGNRRTSVGVAEWSCS